MLETFQERAKHLNQPGTGPYLGNKTNLPLSEIELFFDVETDPMSDICYFHGFVERHDQDAGSEKYISFFANQPTPKDEHRAFKEG